ncbi:pentatricopeptide repeat-containing protein [Canna indica]|uniref:Pentatricopeptide repeat-containing protein n=1 Tax=Canna indica TaxID=4628 RepID=A0AAQ3QD98_9LILI|nr:pentatricopeptide repeat-containing protein [Canna indica]
MLDSGRRICSGSALLQLPAIPTNVTRRRSCNGPSNALRMAEPRFRHLRLSSSPFAKLVSDPTPSSPSISKQEFIHLCSSGRLRQALRGFLPQLWSDPNLFSHPLNACCLPQQSLRQGQELHALIIAAGAASDRFTANHLLNMYSKLGQVRAARTLFDAMPRRNVMSFNILIGGLIQNGDIHAARKLFDDMPVRNVASWNAMITGLAHFELDEEGMEFFLRMRKEGMQPDEFGLGSALRCCAGLKDIGSGRQIHAYIVRNGFERDMCVGSSLAHMYMRSGHLADGERVLKELPVLNVVSCNTVIAGRAQNGDSEGALHHFCLMKAVGLAPDHVTFVSVISACSDLASLGQGRQIHAQAVKVGVDSVVPVRSSLISMYSKCGYLDGSAKIFSESDELDLVLWSSMIAAYGFHGQGEEAIQLFDQMIREGVDPSEVTFLSLLYACSHSGLKDKGKAYFELMTQKYGFKPTLLHYTCMVDLLGRSGCLDEAESLISSLPMPADGIIWKTLLSACKTHKNMEMAERVAEHVLRLDPQDSASYVLLSNIQATTSRWADVSELRRSMKEKRVRKEPGISWVEHKGQVYQFSMGCRSNPRQREIDQLLKELFGRMRESGYLPDTSTVFHDMEEEEKETTLAHHSEKLAIAFAILSFPAGVPIQIMKNLRVCNDCHVAIKYISSIAEREIVVRDVTRFHHFRDGKCSCKDFW